MVEEIEYEDGSTKTEPLSKKARGRKLMDQKANSVADISKILSSIGQPVGDEIGLLVDGKRGRWEEYKAVNEGVEEVTKKRWAQGAKNVVVEVRWRDLLNAEFASGWPPNVIHDVLEGGGVESVYGEAVKAAEAARAERQEKKRLENQAKLESAVENKPEEQAIV